MANEHVDTSGNGNNTSRQQQQQPKAAAAMLHHMVCMMNKLALAVARDKHLQSYIATPAKAIKATE